MIEEEHYCLHEGELATLATEVKHLSETVATSTQLQQRMYESIFGEDNGGPKIYYQVRANTVFRKTKEKERSKWKDRFFTLIFSLVSGFTLAWLVFGFGLRH